MGSSISGSAPYDIWASHVRFHPHLLSLVPPLNGSCPPRSDGHFHEVPKRADFAIETPGVLVVTVVRHPVARLVSAWRYYTAAGLLRAGTPLESLLRLALHHPVIRSEFHPNGMCIELSGVDQGAQQIHSNHQTSYTGEDEDDDDTVKGWREVGPPGGAAWASAAEAAWRRVAKDVRSRRVTALVTERLDESLHALWRRVNHDYNEGGTLQVWEEGDLIYRHVRPRSQEGILVDTAIVAGETGETRKGGEMHAGLNASTEAAIIRTSQFDLALYEAAVKVLDEDLQRLPLRRARRPLKDRDTSTAASPNSCDGLSVAGSDGDEVDGEWAAVSDARKAAELCREPILKAAAAAEARRGGGSIVSEDGEYPLRASANFRLCRCHLLGLDDLAWSDFVHKEWPAAMLTPMTRASSESIMTTVEVVGATGAARAARALASAAVAAAAAAVVASAAEATALSPTARCAVVFSVPAKLSLGDLSPPLCADDGGSGVDGGDHDDVEDNKMVHRLRCAIAAETATAVRDISALQSYAGSLLEVIAQPVPPSRGTEVAAALDRHLYNACPGFAYFNGHRFKAAQRNDSSPAVILVALRGGCSFRDKAHFAETQGYRALIIVDAPPLSVPYRGLTLSPMSSAEPFWHQRAAVTETEAPMTPSLGAGHGITIPVFLISALQGQHLASHLLSTDASAYFFRASIESPNKGSPVDAAHGEFLNI